MPVRRTLVAWCFCASILAAAIPAQDARPSEISSLITTEIDAALKAGETPKAWLTALGSHTEYRILSADEKSVKIELQGNSFPLRWNDISTKEMIGLATSAAGKKNERLLSAAKVALLLSAPDRASEILGLVKNPDEKLQAAVTALAQEIIGSKRSAPTPPQKPGNGTPPATPQPPAAPPPPPQPSLPPLANSLAGKSGKVLRVGSSQKLKTVASAAAAVHNGDIVEIEAGVYKGDVCTWSADNIIIRGVGGFAHLDAGGRDEGGKAIWVVRGNNVVVENIEFSNCAVPDKNGAGIRLECHSLTCRNCYFHDNEDGMLGGGSDCEVVLEGCEFYNNGAGDGYSHNIYIGHIKSFIMRYCYSHGAKIGHNVKSRAQRNEISYCRIMDENDGTASYTIDLPNGGLSYIIGNLIEKGPKAENNTLLTYAEEGGSNSQQRIFVVNNTFVNDHGRGTFISLRGNTTASVMNNLFIGGGNPIGGKAEESGNMTTQDSKVVVDRAGYDYRLSETSAAHNKGVKPGKDDAFDLTPIGQYVHKSCGAPRSNASGFDVGAYEFGFSPEKKEPVQVAVVKDPPKAKADGAAAVKSDPKPPPPPPAQPRTPDQICQGWFSMAMNYKSADMKEDALHFLKRIVETYPETSWCTKARAEIDVLGG